MPRWHVAYTDPSDTFPAPNYQQFTGKAEKQPINKANWVTWNNNTVPAEKRTRWIQRSLDKLFEKKRHQNFVLGMVRVL